jgi:arsenate reductase
VPGLAGWADDGPLGDRGPRFAIGTDAEVALAFKDTYRMLAQRIGVFADLPIRSLDHLSLQTKLKEIGRMQGATAKETT